MGEGSYGEVFSAVHKQTGEVWAIKKIKRSEIDRYVRDECLNLAKCNHSQIITYKDVSLLDLCVLPPPPLPPCCHSLHNNHAQTKY